MTVTVDKKRPLKYTMTVRQTVAEKGIVKTYSPDFSGGQRPSLYSGKQCPLQELFLKTEKEKYLQSRSLTANIWWRFSWHH